MNHAAIYSTHPTVKSILDNPDGSVTCYNADREEVALSPALYQAEADRLAALPPPLPTLTARQLRLGLLGLGVTSAQVEAAIAAITDPTAREASRIEWEYAASYERTHSLITMLTPALLPNLTDAAIDAAWTNASAL